MKLEKIICCLMALSFLSANIFAMEKLELEDLDNIFDQKHQLGFRNAGNHAKATREQSEGFDGDSLCISVNQNNFSSLCPDFAEGLELPALNFMRDVEFLKVSMVFNGVIQGGLDWFAENKKNAIVENWNAKVEEFLSTRFVSENSSFVISDYAGFSNTRDLEQYCGLGKYGRGCKPTVFALIPPPVEENDKINYKNYFRAALVREIRNYFKNL